MKRIRVAHIITRLCQGGAQENTLHTVRLANPERFEADLISGPTHGSEGSIEPLADAAGIPILREPSLVREPSPLKDCAAMRGLTRRLRLGRYDIVHTHTSKAGILGRHAARRAGVPIIVHTSHGNVFHGYFPDAMTRVIVWLERRAARYTDKLIELTPGGIEEHLEQGIGSREQYAVVFSGIDMTPYAAARERRETTRHAFGVPQGGLLIGGAGRLEPVKGFTYFVDAAVAASRAWDGEVPLQYCIAGSGSLAAALSAQAAPLGSRFRFLGIYGDMPGFMAALDLLLVPSVNEGMGRVVLEAGAAGTPVIATRVGGLPDIIREGETGLLTPPRDAEALARAILEMCRNPEARRRMGEAARAYVTPRYSLEEMVRRIERLYEELIDAKGLDRRG